MNYAGKFDAETKGVGSAHSYVHVDSIPTHAPADSIIISDAHLLFHGDFKRSGVDLILSEDGRELVLHDYFKGDKRAPLASPDGAHLTGSLVDALTGHVHVAQAGGAAATAGQMIGHVTKLQGSATVIRNGVSIILNMGDNVEKGDTVQSGSNSTLGITFIDGTVFGLASNARMVLNEMVYDPNGSNNSSLLSLVAGTMTFVAGETAKHGDMKIDTPVATMGIRGTAVLVEIDFSVPGQGGTPNASFQVLVEPDGSTGSYILFDKTTLQPIAIVNVAGQQININNGVVTTTQNQLSPDIQKLILDVFTQKFSQTDQNTKVTFNQTDSINPLLNVQTIKTASNVTITAIFESGNTSGSGTTPQSLTPQGLLLSHVAGPPQMQVLDTHAVQTASFTAIDNFGFDSIGGTIAFQDINVGDRPSVSATLSSAVILDAQGQPVTVPNTQQLAGIIAAKINLALFPNAGNNNNGSTDFIYSLPDSAFNFLAAGEKLILTYNVTVSNNFAQNPETVTRPITITVIGAPAEKWIHTASDGHNDLWTTGQNWKTGHAPLATDDAFIITDKGNANAPSYPAFIDAGTNAVANSLTMDDLGSVAPQLVIASGASLTIGTTLTLNADSELNNAGTLTLGTGGVFQGAQHRLEGGARIVNSGTVEVQGGALEIFVDVANSNGEAGSGKIFVDEGATLLLGTDFNSEAIGDITGGTVTIDGTLDLQGGNFLADLTLVNDGLIDVSGPGNAFHNVHVTANNALEIFGESALTIDQGSDVTNGLLTVDSSGLLTVNDAIITGGTITNEAGGEIDLAGAATLAGGLLDNQGSVNVSGTGNVLDGEAVTNSGAGAIDVTGALTLESTASITDNLPGSTVTVESGASLTFSGTSFMSGGTLINLGTVFVEASNGAALHGVNVINTNGTIQVDLSGPPATLILDDGTTISGGTIDIGDVGTLEIAPIGATLSGVLVEATGSGAGVVQVDDGATLTLLGTEITGGTIADLGAIHVTGDSEIDGGATLTGGAVTVDAKLILDSMTVSGTVITDNAGIETDDNVKLQGNARVQGGAITNNGVLEVAGAATLLNDTLTNGTGTVQVDALDTLTLAGTEIKGGAITDLGTIHVTGDSKIDQNATLNGNGGVTVDANLTLDNVTVSGTTITVDSASGDSVIVGDTVKLQGGATIQGLAPSSGKITNNGLLEIAGAASLLNDTLTNGTGTVQVDGGQTLTLAGTEIKGGAITDLGTIHVTGDSKIDQNATLNGNGGVTVDANLTLDNVTVSGTTITVDSASGDSVIVGDTVKLQGGATIQGLAPSSGKITNNGLLEIAGAASLLNDTLTNGSGTVQVDALDTLTLSGTEIKGGTITDLGTIHVTGDSKIDQNATLTGNGGVTVDANLTLDNVTVSGTTITVDSASGDSVIVGDTVKLQGGATIQGLAPSSGKITNNGLLEIAGAASLLNDTLTNGTGTVQVDALDTLTLSGTEIKGGTIADLGTIHVTGDSKIDQNATLNGNGGVTVDASLTLDNVTVSGTTITVDSASGDSVIVGDTVKLQGGATIQGLAPSSGKITNNGLLEIAGAASLLNDTLTNGTGTVQVDGGQTLTLAGTEIKGGAITDLGTIHVTGDSKIDQNATLNGNGGVTVDANLTLDNVTVSGTTITVDSASGDSVIVGDTVKLQGGATIQGLAPSSGKITNNGLLEIAGAASLLNDTVANGSGTVQVDALDTLTLAGTEIKGGAITDLGTIHVTGDSKIDQNATLNGNGGVTVDANLTLDNVTVSGTTITVDSASGDSVIVGNTVKLQGGATIQGLAPSSGKITNNGLLEIAGAASLLNDTLTNGTGTVQVDALDTLTLAGTEIKGGAITDLGTIHVTGDSKIDQNATLNGNGGVTVDANLTLDNVTVSGTTITVDSASGDSVIVGDTVKLQGGATIQGLAPSSGKITNNGLLEIAGAASLLNDTLTNGTGTVQVDGGQTLTLAGTEIKGGAITDLGTIHVTGDSKIDQNATLNGNGGVTVDANLTLDNVTVSGTTITVDSASGDSVIVGDTVKLQGGATIQGLAPSSGKITNNGLLEIAGAASLLNDTLTNGSGTVQVDALDTLTLSGTEIKGGTITDLGTIHVTGDSKIDQNATLTGNGGVTVDANLTLDNVTVSGTTITVDSAGSDSVIVGDTVELTGGATIQGLAASAGKIANNGLLEIEGAANLVNDTLTNNETLQVYTPGSLTLAGTEIKGGTITDLGAIHVTGDSKIDNGATLTGNGVVTVDANLTLDNVTVSGTTITVDSASGDSVIVGDTVELTGGATIKGLAPSTGKITNNGLLEIEGAANLVNDTLTNNETLQVYTPGSLTLAGTEIKGGTITDLGAIHVSGDSKIDNGATLTGNGGVTVDANLTLNGITVSGTAITVDSLASDSIIVGGTVELTGGATIKGLSASAGKITNNGLLEIAGAATLSNDIVTNGAGTLQVDGGQTLTINATTINGGTLNVSGEIDSTGTSSINGATINNLSTIKVAGGTLTIDPTPVNNSGTISVTSNGTLVLNGETVTNTGNGAVTVASGSTLDFINAGISGGTLGGSGTITTASGNADSTLSNLILASGAVVASAVGELDLTGTINATGAEIDANSGAPVAVGLKNVTLNSATLGGSGKIATIAGNTASTLNGGKLSSKTTVTATAGTLNLTGTIAATGAEIDAIAGSSIAVMLESLTLVGGTLGGAGMIATADAANILNGVKILGGTTVKVTDNTALDLVGQITDSGTIALNSSGDATQLKITGIVALGGGGNVLLTDNANNAIVSDGSAATLNNSDTIAGAGTIGDGHLALVNSGTINATGSHALIIDTGTNTSTSHGLVGSLQVMNTGVLEALAGHTLQIDDNVENDLLIQAGNPGSSSASMVTITGNITGTGSIELFNHATVEIGGSVSSGQTVIFEVANGASTLILDDSHDFHGTIVGLTEAEPENVENHVDLKDLSWTGHMSSSYNRSTGMLTISNGTAPGADHVTLHVTGSSDPAFELASDGHGGTLVDDPAAASGSVTIDSDHLLDITGASTATVSFANSTGTTGELVLDNPEAFTGQIVGFAGDGTPENSDLIDLQNIDFASLTAETYVQNSAGTGGTLTLSDGTNSASINFSGSYVLDNFKFSSDGNGGTMIVDPPVQTASTGSVDQFVFAPTAGPAPVQHTIADFNVQLDTIDLRAFGTGVSASALVASATPLNGGQDTLITVDSNDSILLKNVHAASLHTGDFIVHV